MQINGHSLRPSITGIGRRTLLLFIRNISRTSIPQDISTPSDRLTSDGFRTQRLRHGDLRPLPLPPVLDPIITDRKQKYKEKKPIPEITKFTPFQKKLYENPYAQILATPVRMCNVTMTRLPHYFHLDFHPRSHPETKELWLVPSSLNATLKDLRQPQGLSARVLSNYHLVNNLQRKQNWERSLNVRIYTKLKPQLKQVIWRKDMAAFIEIILQSIIHKQLQPILTNGKNGIIYSCLNALNIDTFEDVGCVIYLRSLRTPADSLAPRVQNLLFSGDDIANDVQRTRDMAYKLLKKASNPTLDYMTRPLVPRLQNYILHPSLSFPTTLCQGKAVPVYSLPDMLGKEMASQLIAGTGLENEACIVIRASEETMSLQMWLLKLQIYRAESCTKIGKPAPYSGLQGASNRTRISATRERRNADFQQL